MTGKSKMYPGWRAPFSAVVGVGWLIFIILWLAFFASDYSVYQNIAIFLASILVTFLLLGGVWAIWSLRMIPKEGWEMMRIVGFKWRIGVSITLPFSKAWGIALRTEGTDVLQVIVQDNLTVAGIEGIYATLVGHLTQGEN